MKRHAAPIGPLSAYTLMEVVLALGLTATILVAVSGALVMYGRVTEAGRSDVERTRLAQSILRSIERDLRSVVFVRPETQTIDPMTGQAAASSGVAGPPSATGSSSSVNIGSSSGSTQNGSAQSGMGAQSGSGSQNGAGSQSEFGSSSSSPFSTGVNGGAGATASGSTTSGTASDPAGGATAESVAAAVNSAIGLIGDSTRLVLQISRPSREMKYQSYNLGATSLGTPNLGQLSDRQSVSWFLAVANGEGLEGAVGNLASGGSALRSSESGVQGLARMTGDQLAMNLADAAGDERSMADAAEIVAPEVNFLEFRYFDGVTWLTEWDSSAYGSLPRAVEILIGFQPDGTATSAQTAAEARLGIEETGDIYRLVVALPLAQGDVAAGAY